MKNYVLLVLLTAASAASAEPVPRDLALDAVRTTAAGQFEMSVTFRGQNSRLIFEKLEPGQAATLQRDAIFATVKSVKSLGDRDNIVTVQLTADGFEGANGSRLSALYVLGVQQGNAYGILNAKGAPIFDSTANIDRDLSYYLKGLRQPSLGGCSEIDALRLLVAYQTKFPDRLLKMAMSDVEGGKFMPSKEQGVCARLPIAENEVDTSVRPPALPTPKPSIARPTSPNANPASVANPLEATGAPEAGAVEVRPPVNPNAPRRRAQRPPPSPPRYRDDGYGRYRGDDDNQGGYGDGHARPRGYGDYGDQRSRGYGGSRNQGSGGYGGYANPGSGGYGSPDYGYGNGDPYSGRGYGNSRY